MRLSKKWRLAAFAGTLIGSAGLVVAATTATGAYFNDTQTGQVSGNLGSIKVSTSSTNGKGGDGLYFDFKNMLPGQFQTIKVSYKNTGLNSEDVYLVFNNAEALHSVNNLGHYGEARITSNGKTIFYSTNLADGLQANLQPIPTGGGHCTPATLSPSGCWPIPAVIKLASNVPTGASGSMTFSFAPGPKWKDAIFEGTRFFCYPLIQKSGSTNPTDQICNMSAPPSYGLPYQIVATQPGVAPSDPNNTTPTP